MAASNFQVTIELAALDNGSKVINLALDKVASKAATVSKRFDNISKGAFAVSRQTAVAGALLAAPLIYGAKAAIDFQDAMGGVSKVVKGAAFGTSGFAAISKDAKEAANAIHLSAVNGAELMESLASGGAAKAELKDMVIQAGKVGIAFDLAAKDAGDQYIKTKNALGATTAQMKLAADSFNFISDNDASTAAQILTYMANGGASVARTLGIGAPQVATFGSALISMGKSGEEAATIMLRFQKAIYLKENKDMLATYKAAGRGAAGLMAVLKQGADIKNTDKQFAFFQRMGEYGTSVSQLSKSLPTLQKNMALVAKQSNYEGSVNAEFENRNKTIKGQLNALKSEASILAVDLGEALLPAITGIVKEAAPLLHSLAAWIHANPTLTGQIIKGVAAASAFSFALSGIAAVVGGVSKTISVLSTVSRFVGPVQKMGVWFPQIATGIRSVGSIGARVIPMLVSGWETVALTVLGVTWPIALAVAAVAAAGFVIYKNWAAIKPMLINTWRTVKNVAVGVYDTVVYYVGGAASKLVNMFAPVKAVVSWIKNAFASIKMPEWLKAAGSWVGAKLAGAANSTANFANEAAARRGISRDMQGAVGTGSSGSVARSMPARLPGVPRMNAAATGGVTVHYSPTISVQGKPGASTEKEVLDAMKKHPQKIAKLVAEANRQNTRKSY